MNIPWSKSRIANFIHPHSVEAQCTMSLSHAGVCIIDDDRLIADIHDLEFGFSVWQVQPSLC